MEPLVVIGFFLILAITAPRWGVDSRPESESESEKIQ
jgi:hypothetical protein